MRILITDIDHVQGEAAERIIFSSDVGRSPARWMGRNAARLGEFEVELDFPDEVGGFEILAPGAPAGIHGTEEAGMIAVCGTVVTIGEDDDPVVGISLGQDIVLVEASDAKSGVVLGSHVAFEVPMVDVYPYEL